MPRVLSARRPGDSEGCGTLADCKGAKLKKKRLALRVRGAHSLQAPGPWLKSQWSLESSFHRPQAENGPTQGRPLVVGCGGQAHGCGNNKNLSTPETRQRHTCSPREGRSPRMGGRLPSGTRVPRWCQLRGILQTSRYEDARAAVAAAHRPVQGRSALAKARY